MHFPWKEPTPVVREFLASRQLRKSEKKTLRQKLLAKNNKSWDNGRINLGQEGDVTWAITINPKRLTDNKLMSQNIEPRIQKLVRTLNRKRYYTLSSCQSHGPDFNCYVTCAIYSTGLAQSLVHEFKKLGWCFSYAKLMNPEDYINSSFDEKTEKMVTIKPNHEQALEAVNNMLESQFDRVSIVQLVIRKRTTSILGSLIAKTIDRWFLDKRIARLTEIVGRLPSENFDYEIL